MDLYCYNRYGLDLVNIELILWKSLIEIGMNSLLDCRIFSLLSYLLSILIVGLLVTNISFNYFIWLRSLLDLLLFEYLVQIE